MAILLEDHRELLADLPHDAQSVLRASWQEATRALSARGLDNYLRGALALHQLGRGEELVVSYLQHLPSVARALGEDVLPDLVNFLLAMASKTSGQVLTLVVQTAPLAAERLADAELFRQYLQVLSLMLAQVPRGLRPMLEHLDRLLTQLTLGGLRRWVQWGAQAYRADFEGQQRYFSLQSPDALAVLQQERRGTLFVDVQRKLNIYLRAMWGRNFFMRPTAGDFESREGLRPFIERFVIHLADAYDDARPDGEATLPEAVTPALEVYRAAANHCAAHLVFGGLALDEEGLDPLERALVEAVEDMRVEHLACLRFPRMREGWLALHPTPLGPVRRAGDLIGRLARAWLAGVGDDAHPWVNQGLAMVATWPDFDDPARSRETGLALAASLREALKRDGLPFFVTRLDGQRAVYRDDNRSIWVGGRYDEAEALVATWGPRQVRRKASLMEMVNEVAVEFAGDDAQEIWVLPTEFWLDEEGVTINSLEGRAPVADPVHYPEWDYQLQLDRPDWVTVLERRPPPGDLALIDQVVADHKPVIGRLRQLIEAMAPQGVQRVRRLEEGDDIDLEAAVRSYVDLRLGRQPDPRIMMRQQRHVRDVAVMVLLDLSESANDTVRGQSQTVLELSRSASVLLAEALHRLGDRFALHGFSSDGRHDVHYQRFKDFDEPWGDLAKARLAGMKAAYSTRMGAALRHAGGWLARQPQRKKILFVVTDGEPADQDVRDPQYLRHDAQRAVQALQREGVVSYCLSLDPHADHYVSRIFGAHHFTVLDRAERLPEQLPMLYLGLTR